MIVPERTSFSWRVGCISLQVQLTAVAGAEEVEAVMVNVGTEEIDVPEGVLRVVVMQLQ